MTMNPATNLLAEITEYLHADDVVRNASTPATRLAIAATLIRKIPRHGTPAQAGFRLRLEDELLLTPATDAP
ncbi:MULTISPECIES: hypothetical protein [Gordonia]|uniref:hypothetical protein n=1 Tax=Gordonia TaxID=2053 RepID=UPI0005EF745D|nr:MULTISPECIES: hypothetical protein [Gordonia]KJR05503.1 hypothetical protein UG54_16225 [Gordonia sihwensis]WFN95180.1 hypothetical protein P5P27_20660 [Gordonia sihwensis]